MNEKERFVLENFPDFNFILPSESQVKEEMVKI
jgi:hypothetical protein